MAPCHIHLIMHYNNVVLGQDALLHGPFSQEGNYDQTTHIQSTKPEDKKVNYLPQVHTKAYCAWSLTCQSQVAAATASFDLTEFTNLEIQKSNFQHTLQVTSPLSHSEVTKGVAQQKQVLTVPDIVKVVWRMDGVLILVVHMDHVTHKPHHPALKTVSATWCTCDQSVKAAHGPFLMRQVTGGHEIESWLVYWAWVFLNKLGHSGSGDQKWCWHV